MRTRSCTSRYMHRRAQSSSMWISAWSACSKLQGREPETTRSRVFARLAHELLGDASAGARRRALVDEALELARGSNDKQTLAEVLDARLHALWDPAGAEDRLATATEIVD